MNIFYLDEETTKAAQYHMDRHVRKMIVEYAQLLSTAHRVLDGKERIEKTKSGRNVRRWHVNGWREGVLYKSTHVNHPSAKWVRESIGNYVYLYNLFCDLCDEYTYRWGKVHATDVKLRSALKVIPTKTPHGGMTIMPQAMDEEYRKPSPIEGYKNYYMQGKKHLAQWTKRGKPDWYAST